MEITNKLWNLCNILRHDGVDSSDYVEQITYLLFLKLASLRNIAVPEKCNWQIFSDIPDKKLTEHLDFVLLELQKQDGILGAVFAEPISRIKKPASIRKVEKYTGVINEFETKFNSISKKLDKIETLMLEAAFSGKLSEPV